MLEAFAGAIGSPLPDPVAPRAHRWAYSIPVDPAPEACLFDPESGVGACGDWCGGARVEGAFLSGIAMAERILSGS